MNETDLQRVVLEQEQLGRAYAGFGLGLDADYPNQQVLLEVRDPIKEEEAIRRFGRVNGHIRYYKRDGMAVGTAANLHKDGEGAAGFHAHVIQDIKDSVGQQLPDGSHLQDAEFFSVSNIGDGGTGVVLAILPPPDQGVGGVIYETLVGFYRGPLIGTALIRRSDDANTRDEVLRIAHLLDQQIQSVLQNRRS